MKEYHKKIDFERKIVNNINLNIIESELIGLSENSLKIWWQKLDFNEKYKKIYDKLFDISQKYGFILDESNPTRNFPVDKLEIKEIISQLKL